MATRKDQSLFGGTRGAETASEPKEADMGPEMDRFETDLQALKASYELFFMGIERLEPTRERDRLRTALRRLQERKIRNTAQKFRRQQLKARMVGLENHWSRILRERETGTYRRDVAKADRRKALLELQKAKEAAAAEGTQTQVRDSRKLDGNEVPEGDMAGASAHATTRPPGATSGAPGSARPRASRAEDLTDNQLQRLYQTYVGARRRCGENANLRYEDMAAALRKQVPQLIEKTGAKAVEFKVVIRSGKAVLKALPRHEDS